MMKKLIFILIATMSLVIFSSCRSVEVNKRIAQEREELDKKEAFRYQLPIGDTKPQKPAFPHVQKAQLKNGLTIFVVEDHTLPIAEVHMVLKTGSSRDPYGLSGLSNLTALMLKEGTKNLSSLELSEAFANLGTEVSINVSKDMTEISCAILSNHVGTIISLMADMVRNPKLAQDDFERIKLMQTSQLSSQQAVFSYVAQTNFLKAAYGEKHPYAYPTAGTFNSVSNLSLKNIQKAYADSYGSNIAALIVVGDTTLKQVQKLAGQHLSGWNKNVAVKTHIEDPHTQKQMHTKLVGRTGAPQTYILIGQVVANQKDKDLPALQVFQNILAGLPTSRLDANLRERKGWTYGVSSQISPLLGKGPMLIASSVQVPYGVEAINEVLNEFENLKHHPVSDEELLAAKDGLLLSFANRYSTVGKIASTIASQFAYSLPAKDQELLYENIAQVTKKDIQAVAQRVLKKEHTVAVAVGDLEALEAPLAKVDLGSVSIEQETANP